MYNYSLDLDSVTSWVYPGGEVGIDLPWVNNYGALPKVNVTANLRNSDDIMKLVMVTQVLKDRRYLLGELLVKYLPYGRQDRVESGRPNAASAMCNLLLSLKYDSVVTWDPHSLASVDLLTVSHTQITHPRTLDEICRRIGQQASNLVIVIPDKGAERRCKFLPGAKRFIQCGKVRDPATGKLSGFKVEDSSASGEITGDTKFLIYDDICDGGGTFLGVLEVLKEHLPFHFDRRAFHLYTTHGIYSKDALQILPQHFATVSCANNLHNKTSLDNAFPIIV